MRCFFKGLFLIILVYYLPACNNTSETDDPGKNNESTQGLEIESVEEANKGKDIPKAVTEFTVEAFLNSMTGIELSKLALKNASDNRVKILAQNILTDHGLIYRKLDELAKRKTITLPIVMDKKHQDFYEKLNETESHKFNRQFIDLIVESSEDNIQLYEKAINDVEDAELNALINKTLSKLKQHVQTAKTLNQIK